MKKRFLTFILTIATMLMCIFGFSACGGNVEFKINFVVENEVYATVSTSGNEVISMPENPTKDDYTFDGWYWDENTWKKPFTANSLLDAPLSSDMKVYAKFNKNHTHEYTPTTTEPTCTEKGLITYTCSCGDSYTEEIPATGEHTWDDGKITTEPTCTEKGVKTFTCTVCETTTYTEDVEALKHDEKTHEAKAPTCTEIGWEEYVTCEREGCEYSTYKEISATGVHTWDKGEETKAPTCTKEGEMTYTCTVCKTATKSEPIDKLPHEHNTEKWTSNATYHWHECECGDKKDEEKHTAGAPATATTPQTCTVCGYILQVETGILFNTLTVDGTKVYGKVSNATTEFSFINEVTVKGNATYVVDNDKDCGSPIYSKTVDLKIGDNTFYVLEMIGNDVKLFTVTIRRRPMYEVTFNANGGTSVEKQVIEEDFLATEPETTRTGYTFTGWDYDFTQAITENTKITASWSANKDTKYTVNYYLQNLDDNNYTLKETVELKGETDTTATAEIKEYTHFTYNESASTISGNITPNGSQVLSIYYTRDTYSIVANNNNAKAGTSTQVNGEYKYDKQFTLTATTNTGYTWLGWYDGETCVCEDEEFTFKAEKDVTYTASWSANKDTKYTVNYYLQNLDDSNYTLHETVELTGETDTTATAAIKEYAHFTYNASKSEISGNINGDGGQVLSVYYTRDSYTISTISNNTVAGMVTRSGINRFGGQITLTATTNAGYTWLGWYYGETLVCETEEFTFKVEKNVTYVATWSIKAEMSNFNFTSTTTSCQITGIKDNTVTKIIVPDYVTSIDSSVFGGCSSLESITLPFVGGSRKTANSTYQYPFGYIFGISWYTGSTATRQYYYGSSTSSVTKSIFYIPTSLKSVTVTGGNILYGAFENCTGLTSVVIPDSVTSIGGNAFIGCTGLTSVVIPESVTSIGDSAFGNCTGLTSVVISENLTSIGNYAFEDCIRLVEVVNKSTHITITKGDSSNGYVGYYALAVYNSGDTFSDTKLSNDNDYIIYTDENEKILVGYNGTEMDLILPSYITKINQNSFRNCRNLTSVVIGENVTSIGNYAFEDCTGLTSVVIGENVASIGRLTFSSCWDLTSVVIPDSVTSIGDYAFNVCNSLTSVYYKGTAEEWSNIAIDSNDDYLTNATRYYYSETAPALNADGTAYDGNYWHYDENGEIVVWGYTGKE